MAINTIVPRSRRALLTGVGGALAALAAQALGRPPAARAADPNDVVLGGANFATTTTQIKNTGIGDAFRAIGSNGNSAVFGDNTVGFGVRGRSVSTGVLGESSSGNAVRGDSTSGRAVVGFTDTGYALWTAGRLHLGTSGVATIAAGATSRVVGPAVNVTKESFVLLTPRANIGSRALWYTTNPAADTLTIRMSSARTSPTKVAWLLLG